MAIIPCNVGNEFVSDLPLISRGKVRDTYKLPNHPNLLLVVATDRISIFDFVLNAEIISKGYVLTAFNIFWRKYIQEKIPKIKHDLVAFGSSIDEFLPEHLKEGRELQKRAVVVNRLRMLPIEAIVRGYLTGSGYKAYKKTAPDHEVCGHTLSAGLTDGSLLPNSLFTPTTKAETGHDEDLSAKDVLEKYGNWMQSMPIKIYETAHEYALSKEIIIADTKFEFSYDEKLADEVLTPDSSRFWSFDEWNKLKNADKSPSPWDKQHVRNYGKSIGIDKKDPENPDDIEFVHRQVIPYNILNETSEIYHNIFKILTGINLENFQKSIMLIK